MSSIIHRNQTKSHTYARYLDNVRSSALWNTNAPISHKGNLINNSNTETQDPTALVWSEIIRKFLKHNPSRTLNAQAATVDQAIHVALNRAANIYGYDYDQIHLTDQPEIGKIALAPLLSTEEDKEQIIQLVDKLHLATSTTPTTEHDSTEIGSSRATADHNAAKIVVGFGYYALGNHAKSIEVLEGIVDSSTSEINDSNEVGIQSLPQQSEKYDHTLLVLSRTILALAYEQTGAESGTIINAYKKVLSTHSKCLSNLSIIVGNEGYEEMQSWVETALYRYALTSRKPSQEIIALEAHRAYHAHSRYWPNSFRLCKRATFYKSYLNLLIETSKTGRWMAPAGGGISSVLNLNSSNLTLASEASSAFRLDWRGEVSSVERSYEKVLRQALTFPKSGSTNTAVLDFIELVVEAWRVGGCLEREAGHVIEILYRTCQQTFHSQRILRHLVTVLAAKQTWGEAMATVELYVQLVMKAKEIEDAEAAAAGDHDSEEDFINTVLLGARIAIKYQADPDQAAKLVAHALALVEAKRTSSAPVSKEVEARVECFAGIAAGARAQLADRETRPDLHKAYLSHLTHASTLDPTAFKTFYHLAFAQAELRDIDAGLASARKAVELNSNHKHAWHLLALLTTASKEHRLALDIVEVGLTNADDSEGSSEAGGDGIQTPRLNALSLPSLHESNIEPTTKNDRLTSNGPIPTPDRSPEESSSDAFSTPRRDGFLVVPNAAGRSGSTSRTSAAPPVSFPSSNATVMGFDPIEDLEAMVQLRMTKNVILEALDGPEVAMSDQQALFAYFATIAPHLKTSSQVFSKPSLYADTVPTKFIGNDGGGVGTSTPRSKSRIRRKLIGKKGSKDANGVLGSSPSKPPSRNRTMSISLRNHLQTNPATEGRAGTSGPASVKSGLTNLEQDQNGDREGDPTEVGSRPSKLLQSLWLMSAATFRRWGKMDECRGAIQEAETLDAEEAEVWVQYGLYSLAMSELGLAIEGLSKALGYADTHVGAVVHTARILKEEGSLELAEGLLEDLTLTEGWDVPEAWFLLAQIYQATDRAQRGRDCLVYALGLEQTKPIRPLKLAVPRCL
ncbi:hypothetical protein CROQUDRAFT_671440 [Cronartium quercuum f. sp. fusiforme G11]|uniref:Uncharacterized protein n=1 Tax=Cronartium quercuum f. sp. fusiforme G11 TaxID=708437 RepID=A0A9P6NKR3_9BASI|nr:hypothetical protein CROQUDRAFT_671440 [Cronartium quercuum f. sp. fusiforme G11]